MRLFIATDLPPLIHKWAIEQSDALKRFLPPNLRLRWTDPAGWHVTLQFLGEQPESQGVRILESMKRAAEGIPPFSISLGKPGSFSGPRMGVLWLGVDSGTEPLIQMASRLTPGKSLQAHVTLARSREKIPGPLLKTYQQSEPCPTGQISQIHLYQSVLDAKGARYIRIQTVPLQNARELDIHDEQR